MARPAHEAMAANEIADVARHRDATVPEHDQVIADTLKVADQVGRQHDAHPVLRDALHQRGQEVPSRQRVEAGQRLVEEEQLRPLRQGDREAHLAALPAGERADLL
jgi:hypothetical protein